MAPAWPRSAGQIRYFVMGLGPKLAEMSKSRDIQTYKTLSETMTFRIWDPNSLSRSRQQHGPVGHGGPTHTHTRSHMHTHAHA